MSTAGIIAVGDELLSGDVTDTNSPWIACELSDRGVAVRELRTVPDEVDRIADAVSSFTESFDHVVVTGGLGSTPDDLTLEGVAAALNLSLEPDPRMRDFVVDTVEQIEADNPEFDFDVEAASTLPRGAHPIANSEGIVPGCTVDSVYVLPGIPKEMKAVFEQIAESFEGPIRSHVVFSSVSESNLGPLLTELHARFDVRVGCYPMANGRKRIKISGTDHVRLDDAREWLLRRPEIDE